MLNLYKKSRPFKCDLCKAAFNKDEDRRAHLLFTHQFLAPQCQSYDMIQNRIQAEDNLTTDYRNQVRHIEKQLESTKYDMRLPIQEFVWLIALTKKLDEFKLSHFNLGYLKTPITFAAMWYESINNKPIPSNYRKPEYADKFDKFMADGQQDIFVNGKSIYSVTCKYYQTNLGTERWYQVDDIVEWSYFY